MGYKNIILNEKEGTVFLKLQGMKIGFGAIGKGYAADKAKDLLMKEGVVAGMIMPRATSTAGVKSPMVLPG